MNDEQTTLKLEVIPLDIFLNHYASESALRISERHIIFEDRNINGTKILANAIALTRILDNLIDNAIAYTNEGGTVEVSIFCTDTTAQVAIKDSGIGIAEQDFERIFERFYRIDKSRSRASGGTGLGLSLVKHAVEQAGGSIEVSSQLEIGSTFTVTLPRI